MRIALFPLESVLLPGETMPLHIFEERYKRLIGRLRTEGGEFGIVLAQDGRVHDCGCMAVLTAVLEEFEDGRLNIVIEGKRRFRILQIHEPEDPEVECIEADVESYDDVEHGSLSSRDVAVGAYVELLRLMGADHPQVPSGHVPLSFRLAASIDFGAQVKQAMLESLSEDERLTRLTAVIRALLPRIEEQRKRAEAIRGNGKGM